VVCEDRGHGREEGLPEQLRGAVVLDRLEVGDLREDERPAQGEIFAHAGARLRRAR
jgi:hypothetical protein